jgi:hypothetical protein
MAGRPLAATLALTMLGFVSGASAQEVSELRASYSGQARWDASSGTVDFVSSGRVHFGKPDLQAEIWVVPPQVKKIVLESGVRVQGALTLSASADIVGQGPGASQIYGTPEPAALHSRGLDGSGGCGPYSAVLASGKDVVVNIRGLTSLDPIGFHFTGAGGAVLHLDHVAAVDDRGGFYNHSDGIGAGRGSTVADSYFSTGDDVIKVYADITVTDTTIDMIRNAVPIQLGWGDYGDGAVGTFKNLKIVGVSGRDDDHAVIAAQAGSYRKALLFDGLSVDNPTASLLMLDDPGATVSIQIDDANISVARYASALKASVKSDICGDDARRALYRCALSAVSGSAISP